MSNVILTNRQLSRWFRICLSGLAAMSVLGAAMPALGAPTQPRASPPASPKIEGFLYGVSADSATDAWAVGRDDGGTDLTSIIDHWNGTSWKRVIGVKLDGYSELDSVSALGPHDVWAGGTYGDDEQAMVEHLDGTGWHLLQLPVLGGQDGVSAISAVSPTSVWAVEYFYDGGYKSAVIHWNGTRWSVVKHTTYPGLSSVSADAGDDAWAMGDPSGANPSCLALHWDGKSWSRVEAPGPGDWSELHAVSADSPTDAWAVGQFYDGLDKSYGMHWDGSSWSDADSPTVLNGYFAGVSALSPTNAVAVGSLDTVSATVSLVEHWNGKSWKRQASPNPGYWTTDLSAVSASSSANAWAVGTYADGNHYQWTLIEHWNGKKWQVS